MKDKLIEVINDVLRYLPWGEVTPHTADDIAERLIENGVTIATDTNVGDKWISVKDRLPEEPNRYLCNVKSFSFKGAYYQTILKYDKGGFIEGHIYTDDVTHWMPLPKPPRGE